MDEVLLNEGAIEATDSTEETPAENGKWGDDDIWGFTIDADEASEESEESDSGADETNQSKGEAVTEADAEEATTDDEDKPDFLDVTYNHEGKKLTKREAREYAQKGMNYDKTRTQLDNANADLARYKQYEQFLNDIKGDFDTIDELMTDTRARMLMDAEKAKGNSITYENAKASVKEKAPKPIDPKKLQADNAVRAFKAVYGDMKAADIPKEVWDDVKVTGDLLGAYHNYEKRNFEKRISELEKELKDEKQRNKNSSRTVGSSKSSGNKNSTKGLVDKIWDSLG